MFYKCLFTVPLQVQTITNEFKPFQIGSVFSRVLDQHFCVNQHLGISFKNPNLLLFLHHKLAKTCE